MVVEGQTECGHLVDVGTSLHTHVHPGAERGVVAEVDFLFPAAVTKRQGRPGPVEPALAHLPAVRFADRRTGHPALPLQVLQVPGQLVTDIASSPCPCRLGHPPGRTTDTSGFPRLLCVAPLQGQGHVAVLDAQPVHILSREVEQALSPFFQLDGCGQPTLYQQQVHCQGTGHRHQHHCGSPPHRRLTSTKDPLAVPRPVLSGLARGASGRGKTRPGTHSDSTARPVSPVASTTRPRTRAGSRLQAWPPAPPRRRLSSAWWRVPGWPVRASWVGCRSPRPSPPAN